MNRKRLALMGRVTVGAALLVLIFFKVDVGRVLDGLRSVELPYLGLTFLIFLTGNLVGSLRWNLLLRAKGMTVPIRSLYAYYLVGFFFSTFLPTSVGGDLMRAVELSRRTGRRADAFSSVLVERIIGLMTTSFMACVAVGLFFREAPKAGLLVFFVAFSGLLLLSLLMLLGRNRPVDRLRSALPRLAYKGLGERIDRGIESIRSYRKTPFALLAVIPVSLAYQVFFYLGLYVISLALGMEVSIVYFFMFMPAITILATIPVSLNGFGIREWAFVYFFQWVGVPAHQALALSLLFVSMLLLFGVIGGAIYTFRAFH